MTRRVARKIELTPIELTVRRLIMSAYGARARERAAFYRHMVIIYEMLTPMMDRR